MSDVRIAIAGGGTGGHIAPALALTEAFTSRYGAASVHFLCTGNELERHMLSHAGVAFTSLPVKRPTGTMRGKATTVISTAMAIPAARRALKDFGATGLVCVGGYASLAGAMAAGMLRLPIVCLEANAVPGRVTRAVSRLSRVCFAHMPLTRTVDCRCEVHGNPVRAAFITPPPRAEARRALGLDPKLPTLLIIGGSQGAQAINDAAISAAPTFADWQGRMQVLHLTGGADAERAETAWKASGIGYRVAAFTHNTSTWMAAADLALTRAGAGTLAELQVCGVPMIMVPYPHAADDHQRANAHYFSALGAGVVAPQESLDAPRLRELIERLLLNEAARRAGREAALASARPDATAVIAERILNEFGVSLPVAPAEDTGRAAA